MVTTYKMNESEIGYRVSKSNKSYILFPFVKEQRVDGSCRKSLIRSRCTLMGFERSYQTIIPFKFNYKIPPCGNIFYKL